MSSEPPPAPRDATDAGAPADVIVRVRGVTCAYGDFTVLRDVSFDVSRREVFVILGGSGCGKSTLLKHLIGLMRPAAGSIEIEGEPMHSLEGDERRQLLRRFGVMFQSGALFSSMSLAKNVALPLEEFTDLPADAICELAHMKLAMVGLSGFETYLPGDISGGMKKRAAVARALALDPQLLFFDEPSAGLDPISSAELDTLILNLRDVLGTTMVIVTHELQSIYAVADRCIVLDKDRKTVVAEGLPARLRDTSHDPYVRRFFRREPEAVTASTTGAIHMEGANGP